MLVLGVRVAGDAVLEPTTAEEVFVGEAEGALLAGPKVVVGGAFIGDVTLVAGALLYPATAVGLLGRRFAFIGDSFVANDAVAADLQASVADAVLAGDAEALAVSGFRNGVGDLFSRGFHTLLFCNAGIFAGEDVGVPLSRSINATLSPFVVDSTSKPTASNFCSKSTDKICCNFLY
jgi:hypothetical protein